MGECRSDDLRFRVVEAVAGGSSRRAAADRFSVSASSAIRWSARAANATVTSLRSFFGRQIPIWEGHVRDGLAGLISHATANQGNSAELARGTVAFMGAVATGFSPSAFGNRFVTEAENGCAGNCNGKPLHLQAMARHIVDNPDHRGIGAALAHLRELVANEPAFADVRVHHTREFAEAIQLAKFEDADEGFAEISRRRTHARPKLPPKAISTIHKA